MPWAKIIQYGCKHFWSPKFLLEKWAFSYALKMSPKMFAVLIEITKKSIIKHTCIHTLHPSPLCKQLIHGGMDSLGEAPFLTAHWAGCTWSPQSETLLIAAGIRKPEKTVHWTAKALQKGVGEELWLCWWNELTLTGHGQQACYRCDAEIHGHTAGGLTRC